MHHRPILSEGVATVHAVEIATSVYKTVLASTEPQRIRLVINARTGEEHAIVNAYLGRVFEDSPGTARLRASHLCLFLNWAASKGYDLEQAGAHLRDFQIHLRTTAIAAQRRSQGRNRADTTRSGYLASVRAFYRWAIGEELVSESLTRRIWRPDGEVVVSEKVADYRRVSAPSLGESKGVLGRVLDGASPRDLFLFCLLVLTGMRAGTVAGIRRSDVHAISRAWEYELPEPWVLHNRNRVEVCRVQGPHIHTVRRLDNPNGALHKSRRAGHVSMASLLMDAYDGYMIARAELFGQRGEPDDNEMLLLNLGYEADPNTAMKPKRIGEVVGRWGRLAGVPDLHPHQMRHAFASILVNDGTEVDTVAVLLGHASPETTRRTYVHISEENKAAATSRVAHLLARPAHGTEDTAE